MPRKPRESKLGSKRKLPNLTSDKLQAAIDYSLYKDFSPFEGQAKIHAAMFERGCRIIFVQCGRGWGKTFSSVWLASKWALERPDSYVLHLAPQYKQAKKIVWYPKLYEKFIVPELITRTDKQETYHELLNGSRIEMDGSDNFDSQRGLKPDLVIADEYRDFSPEWIDVMFPNVGKSGGTIMFIGTPPEFPQLADGSPHHYVQWADQCKRWMKDDPDKVFWINLPTSDNPYYPKDFLADEERRLTELDLPHVWKREYLAEVVKGSQRQIFRGFREAKHVTPQEDLLDRVGANPELYEFWVSADPGTKSVFAVLFMAIDHYNSQVLWLDEIYETDASQTTTRNIVPQILGKVSELMPELPIHEWNLVADNAAAWFIEEAFENFHLSFTPTEKRVGDKEEGISLLKEIFNERESCISDTCEHTALEFVNYQTDKRGRVVKERDHNIDNSRYVLKASTFSFVNREIKKKVVDELESPFDRMAKDYEEYRSAEDWSYGIE